MRIFLNTTEDWKEIKDAVKTTEDYLSRFKIKITLNKIDLDISNKAFYETKKSLSWFNLKEHVSFSNPLIKGLGMLHGGNEYDIYGIIVDIKKSLSTDLYGQYSSQHNTIEVYADKKRTKRHGFARTTSSLIHEILHAISDKLGKEDKLHDYLEKYNGFDEYLKYLQPDIEDMPDKLLPLIERKRDALFLVAKLIGLDLRMTSGFRSIQEQDELYAQGRTKPGKIVTNAKGGESLHNYGVAFDVVDKKLGYEIGEAKWKGLGVLWNWLGGEWGGDWTQFVDKPHFEMKLGYNLKDFQKGKVDYNKYL